MKAKIKTLYGEGWGDGNIGSLARNIEVEMYRVNCDNGFYDHSVIVLDTPAGRKLTISQDVDSEIIREAIRQFDAAVAAELARAIEEDVAQVKSDQPTQAE